MGTGKKIGWLFMSFVPFLVMVIVQAVVAVIITVRFIFMYGEQFYEMYMDNIMSVSIQTNIVVLLIMGSWYFLWIVRGKQKGILPVEEKHFGWRQVLSVLSVAVGVSFLIDVYMGALQLLLPSVMESYMDLMDGSGIGELTFASTFASVIMAPLVEELTFRGLTVEALNRTGWKFWTVNIIQALLFGIIHFNLVQGSYAFLLGILLGYAGKYCGTLWAPILIHMFFNFFGTYGVELINMLPVSEVMLYVILLVLGVVITVFSLKWFKRSLGSSEEPEAEN